MSIERSDIIKEMDMIQSCISRMAKNSFAMKGWHITITSALIAFFLKESGEHNNCNIYIIMIFITLIFWYLDSYYLLLERKYRWKYQWVVDNRLNADVPNNNFYMNMNPNNADMWVSASNGKSIRLAKYSSKVQNPFLKYLFHLIEVVVTMFANVMQAQYMLVIILVLVVA